jgi:hypothetical protein
MKMLKKKKPIPLGLAFIAFEFLPYNQPLYYVNTSIYFLSLKSEKMPFNVILGVFYR